MINLERLCFAVGFDKEQTATLLTGKPVEYNGELYSEEHKRKFMAKDVKAKVFSDNGKFVLTINLRPIGEWFKEQFEKLRQSPIDKALENVSGHVMGFKRLSNHPYEIDYISTDVREVANYEQKIPVEWINEEGNDITQELYEYLYPLIQGEVHVTYKDGIPSYYSCKHLEK